MKRLKKVFGATLVTASLLFFCKSINAQSISNYIFGQNAWMPYAIGAAVYNGRLSQQWNNVRTSNATIIRFGGISSDRNMPTNAQYIQMIDDIRSNGMEPTIQVPFNNYQYTAQQAADIVRFINITSGKNIKYWSIGNEPDLGYSFTTAAQIAAYIRPFASAMKAIDPSILIIGPECASFNQSIYDGLTTPNGPNDITGRDGAGRFYVDVISFHTYPFNGSQTRAQVVSKLTSAGSLKDNLIHLNSQVAAANAVHGRVAATALKTAITEANIDWQNSPTDDLYGVGANSFIGGQFIAEMMGVAMKNGVGILNFWSIIEGNNQALNIGYIDAFTGNKKPFYYHFQLLASNFNGNYVDGTSNISNIKSFGSQNAQNTNVLVMNEDQTNNYNYTVRLNTAPIAGANPLKININAGIAAEYNDLIQNQSSMLLTFDPNGVLVKKCIYSLASHASLNLPPACQTFSIPPNPTPTITANNATICSGSYAVINAGGATAYTWNPGALTGATQTLSPALTTIYTITGSNGNASAVKTITVNVNTGPVITANDANICKGGSVVISASGAANYTWSPGALSGPTQTLNPAITTAYTITGSNGTCSSSKILTVNVSIPPTVIVPSATIVSGNPTVITASGATNYTWYPGLLTGASQTLNPVSTMVYTIVGANGSCTGISTSTITVSPLPTGIKIDKNNNDEMAFFPNPVKAGEAIELKVTELPFSVELFTISGAVIFKEEEINSERHFISTIDLPKGIYIISIINHKGQKLLSKLIIN